jgi:hypothetical protein
MKTARKFTLLLGILLLCSAAARGQEKEEGRKLIPVKVQVVFSEYEGERKVASLPYTLMVGAPDDLRRSQVSKVRVGVRVPISTQVKEGPVIQYHDVGSYIDAHAAVQPDGKIVLDLSLRRSFIYSPQAEKAASVFPVTGDPTPIFRNFESDMRLVFKDGETIQSNMATDPVSGRVLKVDVTVTVVK